MFDDDDSNDSVLAPPDDPAHDPLPTTAPSEPAMTVGAWVSFTSLGVSIMADLGLPLTDAQQRWLYLLAIFFGPVLSGLLIRERVFAPDTVDQIVQSMKWRLRGAELDASDAIAARQTTEQLYPALYAVLSGAVKPAPDSAHLGVAQPAGSVTTGVGVATAPSGEPQVYPLLSGQGERTEALEVVRPQGRHRQG